MYLRIAATLMAIAVIAVIAAGCGGGVGDGTETNQGTAAAGNSETADAEAGGSEGGDGGGNDGDGGDSGGDGSEPAEGNSNAGDGAEGSQEGNSQAEAGDGGESQEGSEGSQASGTKQNYIQQGDAICNGVPTAYQALLQKLPKAQQENPSQSVPKAAIPPLETAVEEFEALSAPQGDEGKAAEIVAALETAIVGLEQNPMGELSGPNSSFAKFSEVTQAYGFQVCPNL